MCQCNPISVLWEYLILSHPLKKADVIIGFGSYDTSTAERGAKLWLSSFAPVLLFSGGLGKGTDGFFSKPEADTYAEIASNMGVPAEHLLIENRSTNSGENIRYTKQILLSSGIEPIRIIVVHKPYMGRRVYATLRKQWPGPEIIIAPCDQTYEQHRDRFLQAGGSEDEIINSMVGDLQRIAMFPGQGYQIPQEIPEDVWKAFYLLVEKGYTRYLLDT